MATRKAAYHASHVADMIAARRGVPRSVGSAVRGRGFGIETSDPTTLERLPRVIAGVRLEMRKRRELIHPFLRRRPRRVRRPRPTPYGILGDPDRLAKWYMGEFSSKKARRQRARHRRHQRANTELMGF